jgi:para-aminobenzoate synthetase/4-amino-4-deoxychorismate lyase
VLAKESTNSGNIFLYHKTTHRQVYKRASLGKGDVDDVILFNERGQVTESTIANLAVKKDDLWITPKVECGLLPGVMREELLERKEIQEGIITLDDLKASKSILLFNSLRGKYEAQLS